MILMAGIKMTYILCYDDHRSFTEDIRKRFSDETRYQVESYHNVQEFMENWRRDREKNSCRVAIIGVPDAKEQFEMIDEMTLDIKKADPAAGLILLVQPEKMDDLKKAVRFNIDAYIPRNSNSILRIHNAVKKLISEQNITIFRRKRNFSFYVLLGFLLLAGVLILIVWLKLPRYF
jgi:DNA-binding NarL/FixJ family response regulator